VEIHKGAIFDRLKIKMHYSRKPWKAEENYVDVFFKKGIFSEFRRSNRVMKFMLYQMHIQGVFESCAEILSTSYWLHVELGKNI
jgi:hypothetical protein